jgi:hypothetical protein
MDIFQESKYDAVDGKIVNRSTGVAIPDDEPVFILRAKDRHSVEVLSYYQLLCQNANHKTAVASRVQQFQDFIENSREKVKEPDSDASALVASDLL